MQLFCASGNVPAFRWLGLAFFQGICLGFKSAHGCEGGVCLHIRLPDEKFYPSSTECAGFNAGFNVPVLMLGKKRIQEAE